MTKSFRPTLFLALVFASGCSPSSIFSQEGLAASVIGGAVGAGSGLVIGQHQGKKTENALLGTAVGAGAGALAGGLLHENNLKMAQQRKVVIREAQLINSTQKEIDALRERLNESTTWGGNEVLKWNDRYWGDSYNVPFEGDIRSR